MLAVNSNQSNNTIELGEDALGLEDVWNCAFRRHGAPSLVITDSCADQIRASEKALKDLIESGVPLYGVTTGYGDSCSRTISPEDAERLQKNLVGFLNCGTGEPLPREVVRATCLLRLKSLSRGYSGVSLELVERMRVYLERDWLPVIPRRGSLGASGDLVPLSYYAQVLQGEGRLSLPDGSVRETADVLRDHGMKPYQFKAKEGLALVNGTSVMAALAVVNFNHIRFIHELSVASTAWMCLALNARPEAFGALVNERAKLNRGQRIISRWLLRMLHDEGYTVPRVSDIRVYQSRTKDMVQNRYSIRCVPQILGPIVETLLSVYQWLQYEINSTSDNPIVAADGEYAMGGNFYGGYISHAMDYLKICLGHVADLSDRQVMHVMDEHVNGGLPPNLAAWNRMPEEERHLHHGLKGVNIAVSALTSEIIAKTMPNGPLSRSSEVHNQDKVSLGMSAATQCAEMVEKAFAIQALTLISMAQALDLRGVRLVGSISTELYQVVRDCVPFIDGDRSLHDGIDKLIGSLKELSGQRGKLAPVIKVPSTPMEKLYRERAKAIFA